MGAGKINIVLVFRSCCKTWAISATSENTSDINPQFYKDPLRLHVNNIEGKITEFLNALKLQQCLVEDITLLLF